MAGIKTIKIFLASPMEVVDERRQFRELIKQINEEHAIKQGFAFDVVCWEENVLPGVGIDAQDVVNQQIDMNYDVFVALFKSKVGTPTHRYLSGTIEEYERARMLKDIKPELKIMCYFLGDTDSNAIRDLKTKFNSEGILLNGLKNYDGFLGTFLTETSSISTAELNSIYCYLNILGMVSLSNKKIRCTREHARQLI